MQSDRVLERLSFPIQYLEIGESFLRARGFDVEGFYRLYGSSKPDINSPLQTINGLQLRHALQLFLNLCESRPAPLTQIMPHFPVTMHGPLGVLALTSGTLGESLDNTLEYITLVMPAFAIRRETQGGKLHLVFERRHDFSPVNEILTEIVMATFLQIRPFLAEAPASIFMEFQHAPLGEAQDYALGQDVQFSFGARLNQIIMDSRDMKIPLLAASRSSRLLMQATLEKQRLQQQGKRLVAQQVRRLLQQALQQGKTMDAMQVAEKLNISVRTLSRRLQEEGSTLPKLQVEVGVELAELLLVQSDKSVAEIARSAGFQDASSFARAFRRLKGIAPSRFRGKQD